MGMARWAVAASALVLSVSACGTATAPGQPGASTTSTTTAVPANCPSGVISGVGPASQAEPTQEILGAYADRCDFKSSVSYQNKSAEEARQMFGNALSTWLTVQRPLPEADAQQLAARCGNNPIWHLPTSAAPLAVSWNLPGVDRLTLTPSVLAKLLSGAITRWDDPAIAQLNPDVQLPGIPVTPVLATDSPGITATLTDWLTSAAGPDWPNGETSEPTGPGKQTESLTDSVSALLGTPGTMSVLPLSYTRTNSLPTASIDFGAGPVAPTPETGSRALEAVEIPEGNDLRLQPDYRASAGAYPLTVIGYQVVCSRGNNSKQGPVLRDFFSFWTTPAEQQALADLGLAPLPEGLRGRVSTAAGQIR
ncbi:hypothetical protein CGZ98_15425 [Enemella evansiae]|uniref:substrate-binding domain-containing protein n=1 Tax=Enemella evansiae TaxID=2016499 RepID=UPI000B963992|nr:substrate-binding domain-containing protein [Enemella evansiae]OYO09150.1 hypothetical protein CGZ98_15425 [Enemella evansiae]